MIKVAINGFGRIGRTVARLITEQKGISLVAINDLADGNTMAHLWEFDSVHGKWKNEAHYSNGKLKVNDQEINYFSEKDPEKLPWEKMDIDFVLECTGFFREKENAEKHLKAGAKKVIISAPSPSQEIKTVVLGVNEHILTADDTIVSNASCTTNSAAPLIALLDAICHIKSGYITTIHSYTGDQRLHDAPHKDLRRARAAAQSIIPTTTGAAKAITKIFPHLEGQFGGCGIRVPVPDGSLTDITCIVEKPLPIEKINQEFKQAATERFNGILEYQEKPIVSVDVINNPYSCVFDAQLTSVIGNMVKVVGWYDNESGYAHRLVDLVLHMNTLET